MGLLVKYNNVREYLYSMAGKPLAEFMMVRLGLSGMEHLEKLFSRHKDTGGGAAVGYFDAVVRKYKGLYEMHQETKVKVSYKYPLG